MVCSDLAREKNQHSIFKKTRKMSKIAVKYLKIVLFEACAQKHARDVANGVEKNCFSWKDIPDKTVYAIILRPSTTVISNNDYVERNL